MATSPNVPSLEDIRKMVERQANLTAGSLLGNSLFGGGGDGSSTVTETVRSSLTQEDMEKMMGLVSADASRQQMTNTAQEQYLRGMSNMGKGGVGNGGPMPAPSPGSYGGAGSAASSLPEQDAAELFAEIPEAIKRQLAKGRVFVDDATAQAVARTVMRTMRAPPNSVVHTVAVKHNTTTEKLNSAWAEIIERILSS